MKSCRIYRACIWWMNEWLYYIYVAYNTISCSRPITATVPIKRQQFSIHASIVMHTYASVWTPSPPHHTHPVHKMPILTDLPPRCVRNIWMAPKCVNNAQNDEGMKSTTTIAYYNEHLSLFNPRFSYFNSTQISTYFICRKIMAGFCVDCLLYKFEMVHVRSRSIGLFYSRDLWKMIDKVWNVQYNTTQ